MQPLIHLGLRIYQPILVRCRFVLHFVERRQKRRESQDVVGEVSTLNNASRFKRPNRAHWILIFSLT